MSRTLAQKARIDHDNSVDDLSEKLGIDVFRMPFLKIYYTSFWTKFEFNVFVWHWRNERVNVIMRIRFIFDRIFVIDIRAGNGSHVQRTGGKCFPNETERSIA